MTVRKFVVVLVGMSAFLWGSASAPSAQKMTEQFIPIGQSPGPPCIRKTSAPGVV